MILKILAESIQGLTVPVLDLILNVIHRHARIGLKIPELSYDQVPQSNHRHYLTRVATFKENLFALGDYDDEHNHAEIYNPLRKVFKWSSRSSIWTERIMSWKSTKLPSGRFENFLKSELDRGRRLSLSSRVSSFRRDLSLFEFMLWAGQKVWVRPAESCDC